MYLKPTKRKISSVPHRDRFFKNKFSNKVGLISKGKIGLTKHLFPPISLKFGMQLDIRIPYEEPKRFFKSAVPSGSYGVFKGPSGVNLSENVGENVPSDFAQIW